MSYYKSRTKASKARERGGIYNDGEGSFLNNSKMVARGPKNSKDLAKMKRYKCNSFVRRPYYDLNEIEMLKAYPNAPKTQKLSL